MSAINATTLGASSALWIALGNVPGVTGLLEPGERDGLEHAEIGVDIWRGTALQIPFPNMTVGEQMTVVSTSANDIAGGTGVQEIHVHYLDANGLEQQETVVMNGLTGVNTVATNIIFVNKIHAIKVGTNGVALGDVKIARTGDAARVYDVITVGGNMSLTSIYRVPRNKRFVLTGWHSSISGKDKRATVRLRANTRDGDVFENPNPAFLFIDTMNLEANALASNWPSYVLLPPDTIIKVTGWVETANAGAYVSSSWHGFLVPL